MFLDLQARNIPRRPRTTRSTIRSDGEEQKEIIESKKEGKNF